MPYFTVTATDSKTGHKKTHKGIKALDLSDAIFTISMNHEMNRHHYDGWMSKHGFHGYPNTDRWTDARNRHEGREQSRSFWAVLSRRGRRSHKRALVLDDRANYLRMWQVGIDEWDQMDRVVDQATSQVPQGIKDMDVPHG